MPSRLRGGSDTFRVDVSEFKALNERLKQADKKVARQLRKTLKAAADDAVAAVKDEALKPPPPKVGTRTLLRRRKVSSRVRSRGMRASLARATTASLTKSNLTVRTSQRRMPAGMGPMVKAWNSRRFRHPVFGNRKRWVDQNGTAYFSEAMKDQREPLLRNLALAMEKVQRELM